MNVRILESALLLMVAATTSFADAPEFTLNYHYRVADTQQPEQGAQKILLNEQTSKTNDPRIDKAILVAKLGDVISETLTTFKAQCNEQVVPELPFQPMMSAISIMPPFPPTDPEHSTLCSTIKDSLANELLTKIYQYATQTAAMTSAASDEKIAETLDLLRKLAANMRAFDGYHGSLEIMPSMGMGMGRTLAANSLSVATGGAQDFGFFKNIVNSGVVPQPENFDAKGFLSEFDLPMGDARCDQLICVTPVYKYDNESKKLFVAVSMNTNITEATFVRKPLNLSVVIDISGSMQANDETERSRLEWAKEAAIKTVSELTNDDYLSLVVFDSDAEVLIPTTQLSEGNRAHIIDVISALQTKGSTNLYDGLKAGYELVSNNALQHPLFSHRVILISDAGLNTGATDEAVNVRLVANYAAENIGLTAIGLGLNFNQDFISGISQSLGGNYIYAHSGKDMVRYFSSFKFLVSPVAHQLKAELSFANTKATLVKAYGIPGEALTSTNELINIQSLFFTNQGGGALLLEYVLE